MKQLPLVSIVMITYGHEQFIEEAITGVLMQECDFEIELIIANDCSPDMTDDVVKTIIENHPRASVIKYFKHDVNKGMMDNFIFALKQAKGKYIAICEGDDYWTDFLKLRKQKDFLEKNSQYEIHSGKANMLIGDKFTEVIGNPLSKKDYSILDFFTNNNLISCTVMFRNDTINFDGFKNLIFLDWMLYVLLLSNKKSSLAYVSDEVQAVYRIHAGGIMQTLQDEYSHHRTVMKQISAIKKYSRVNYNFEQISLINTSCLKIFKSCYSNKNFIESLRYFLINIRLTSKEAPLRKYMSFVKHHKFDKV